MQKRIRRGAPGVSMFEVLDGLSDRAWTVVTLARREAVRLGDPLVLPAHLLAALSKEGSPAVAKVLATQRITLVDVRQSLARRPPILKSGPGKIAGYSFGVESVISFARDYAELSGHEKTEPAHLLASLACVDPINEYALGYSVIKDCGIDSEAMLQEVFRGLHEGQSRYQRSILTASRELAAHPGADYLERLLRRVVPFHKKALARGDYLAAVTLRGTLRKIASNRRKPVGAWRRYARELLKETMEVHAPEGGEE